MSVRLLVNVKVYGMPYNKPSANCPNYLFLCYISDYRGIRIASTGDRFYIDQAIIWNVVDKDGKLWGQAATFANWEAIV
jgi:hypothetical protein